MNFKMTFSDFKEIAEYILKKSNKTSLSFTIEPGEHRMAIEFHDSMEDKCIVTGYSARAEDESNLFPTVTKTARLNDDL